MHGAVHICMDCREGAFFVCFFNRVTQYFTANRYPPTNQGVFVVVDLELFFLDPSFQIVPDLVRVEKLAFLFKPIFKIKNILESFVKGVVLSYLILNL
jgi:hypothetical protein